MYVSVVIPCYNVAEWVADALNSALAQDYPLLEIIAVDNGSTDDTLAVLYTYARQHPQRIRVLQEARRGAPAARNAGWRAARGQWIQFLDADDVLLPGKISRQMGLAGGEEESGLFIAGMPCYQTLDGVIARVALHIDPWLGLLRGMELGQTSANLWRRSGLERVNGWDEALPSVQDPDLMFRLMQWDDRVIRDEAPACLCRARMSGSITQSDPEGTLIRHCLLRGRIIAYLERHKPSYWLSVAPLAYHALYFYLRMLASHNLKEATRLYHTLLPSGFLPIPGLDERLGAIPVWATRLLGFRRAERLRLYLRAVLPARCRAWARRWKG